MEDFKRMFNLKLNYHRFNQNNIYIPFLCTIRFAIMNKKKYIKISFD